MERKPLLAVSMGDPVGIGPEVVAKALSVGEIRADANVAVFGDSIALSRAADSAQLSIEIRVIDHLEEAARWSGSKFLPLIPVPPAVIADRFSWASPTPESDRAQLVYIERAMEVVAEGFADALVTAPISKASIVRAGAHWPGHTEMLADLCSRYGLRGGPVMRPVMMLAGNHLRVVPLTTHIPLSEVPRVLDAERLLHAIRVIHQSFLTYFGRRRPRIAVAGLNPHAGEHGLFGNEERTIIEPAIAMAREEGATVIGPLPGDTVFRRAVEGEFDVVIGMYHDQALIPIKLLDFDRAVNVTLGLPIIRTSVDHGTAYDLAGKGVASAGSMIAALRVATSMVRERRRNQ